MMDFDPRFTSDGNGYGSDYGVHCNFHFGYTYDVFDEHVKNEEACVQALQHLILKADAEIEDLRDELAVLQCELKWTGSDDQNNSYEVLCTVFKRRVDCLTKAIQRARNGNILNGQGLNSSLKIQKPAERIYDIIDALNRSDFIVPDEQVGDLSSHNSPLGSSDSTNIDMDLSQQDIISESSAEFEEQPSILNRLEKPLYTVSEESSSDAARFATKDMTEVREICESDVRDPEKSEVDVMCTSEGKSGRVTCDDTVTAQTPPQVSNDEGISKSSALQHEESEICKAELKTGTSWGLSLLGVKTEIGMMPVSQATVVLDMAELKTETSWGLSINSELDDHDASFGHVSANFFSKGPDREGVVPAERHLNALENQSQSIPDLDIMSIRRESRKDKVKLQGQEVQRKKTAGSGQSTSSVTLKPRKKIVKNSSSSVKVKFGPSGLPAREIGTEADVACGNPPALEAKVPELNGVSIESSIIQSPEGEFSIGSSGAMGLLGLKPEDGTVQPPNGPKRCVGTKGALKIKLKSPKGAIQDLESPYSAEVKASVTESDPLQLLAAGSKSANLENRKKPEKPELPPIDVESLKQTIAEEHLDLYALTARELRTLVQQCRLRGASKLRKELMIERLNEYLATQQ